MNNFKDEMDKKVAQVLSGYFELDREQKETFIKTLNEYNEANVRERRKLKEATARIDTGPIAETCPCCGK